MPAERKIHRLRGWTLVEVFALVIITAIGLMLLLPVRSGSGLSKRGQCALNARQVVIAEILWAADRNADMSMQIPVAQGGTHEFLLDGKPFRHFQALSQELSSPKFLSCPADKRKPAVDFASLANANISYFVNLDATVKAREGVLVGDRNVTLDGRVSPGILEVRSNALPSWGKGLHPGPSNSFCGNIALMDSHVERCRGDDDLQEAFRWSGIATNRLVIP